MSYAASLATEQAFYQDHKEKWLREHEGMFVLIKGSERVGLFPTMLAADQGGLERFGIEPFLIKQILRSEPIAFIPAFNTFNDADS